MHDPGKTNKFILRNNDLYNVLPSECAEKLIILPRYSFIPHLLSQNTSRNEYVFS